MNRRGFLAGMVGFVAAPAVPAVAAAPARTETVVWWIGNDLLSFSPALGLWTKWHTAAPDMDDDLRARLRQQVYDCLALRPLPFR